MMTLYGVIRRISEEKRAARREPRFATSTEVCRRMEELGLRMPAAQKQAELHRLAGIGAIRIRPGMHNDLFELVEW